MKKSAIFVAGGTGGHINPAITMSEFFKNDNYDVSFISGQRHLDYQLLKNFPTLHLQSEALLGKTIYGAGLSLIKNFFVFLRAFFYLLNKKPQFIFGAGGYICGPVCMAAFLQGIPVFILEQNAVMGFTNRLISKIAKKVFLHFSETPTKLSQDKIEVTGNPVRKEIVDYDFTSTEEKEIFKIMVFGGSLGAKEINEMIVQLVSSEFEFPVKIIHQSGKGKFLRPKKISQNIKYENREYIEDMADVYRWADLIISRSGATTISELRFVGKPCILLPLAVHSDKQQYLNAKYLKEEALFNVHISVAQGLAENNCAKLKEIIVSEFQMKASNQISIKNELQNPGALIKKAILENV